MGTAGYFDLMARLMGVTAPPPAADVPILARMARIGIVPGQPLDMKKLDPSVQIALSNIPQAALRKIEASKTVMGDLVNGWVVTKGLGTDGTNYLKRAVRLGGVVGVPNAPDALHVSAQAVQGPDPRRRGAGPADAGADAPVVARQLGRSTASSPDSPACRLP